MVGRIQLLMGCWAKGLSLHWLLARGHSPFLAKWASSMCLIKACQPRRLQKESSSQTAITVFYNLITEVTSCHLSFIHWLDASPYTQLIPKGSRLHKDVNTMTANDWGHQTSLPTADAKLFPVGPIQSLNKDVARVTSVFTTCGSLLAVFSYPALRWALIFRLSCVVPFGQQFPY